MKIGGATFAGQRPDKPALFRCGLVRGRSVNLDPVAGQDLDMIGLAKNALWSVS